MDPREQFAVNLRAERERQEISQEELGRRSGIHRTEVSLLERGARDPRLDTIARLAAGLGITVGDLVAGI